MRRLNIGSRIIAAAVVGFFLPVAAVAAEALAPAVSLSFRGVSGATIEQGEPLSVAVLLTGPTDSGSTIQLAPTEGTWVDAISVGLTKASDATVLARAAVTGQPDSPRVTLDPLHPAGGLWLFSGAAMQLPPGDYFVAVRLKIDGGSGWSGEARSSAWPLKIVAPSDIPLRIAQRTLAKATEAVVAGKLQEAAGIIDAQLNLTPDDRSLLLLRAVLAERVGNLTTALLCVNRASRRLAAKGPPPADLYALRTRLQAKMREAQPADAVAVPAWSWAPEILLTSRAGIQADVSSKITPTPVAAILPPSGPAQTQAPSPTAAASAVARNLDVRAGASVASLPPAEPTEPRSGVLMPSAELNDAKVNAEANGQWAANARAGSQYSSPNYAAMKATGAPDVPVTGDSPSAWCPAAQGGGADWLEVSFAKPVHATGVRVRQSNCPGAIVRIDAVESDGTSHVWWEGVDPLPKSDVREIVWFAVRVPKTSYLVAQVKITLNLAAVPGWKQIDAVQLVGAE